MTTRTLPSSGNPEYLSQAIHAYLAGVEGTGPRLSLKAAAAQVGKSQRWLCVTLQRMGLPRNAQGIQAVSQSPRAARRRELYHRNKRMKPL